MAAGCTCPAELGLELGHPAFPPEPYDVKLQMSGKPAVNVQIRGIPSGCIDVSALTSRNIADTDIITTVKGYLKDAIRAVNGTVPRGKAGVKRLLTALQDARGSQSSGTEDDDANPVQDSSTGQAAKRQASHITSLPPAKRPKPTDGSSSISASLPSSSASSSSISASLPSISASLPSISASLPSISASSPSITASSSSISASSSSISASLPSSSVSSSSSSASLPSSSVSSSSSSASLPSSSVSSSSSSASSSSVPVPMAAAEWVAELVKSCTHHIWLHVSPSNNLRQQVLDVVSLSKGDIKTHLLAIVKASKRDFIEKCTQGDVISESVARQMMQTVNEHQALETMYVDTSKILVDKVLAAIALKRALWTTNTA